MSEFLAHVPDGTSLHNPRIFTLRLARRLTDNRRSNLCKNSGLCTAIILIARALEKGVKHIVCQSQFADVVPPFLALYTAMYIYDSRITRSPL